MIRLAVTLLFTSSILFFSSCEEEQKPAQLSAVKKNINTLSLSEEEVQKKPDDITPISGLELFKMDTITEEEFEHTAASYKNLFITDSTLFPKKDGVINIKLKDGKSISYKDYYEEENEAGIRQYYYEGHYSDRLYYIQAHYYEDMEGLLIQADGTIEHIYYSPDISSDGAKFYSLYTEYDSMGDFAFLYYEFQDGTYKKKGKLEFSKYIIDKITWHNSDAIYCKIYSDKEASDGVKKHFTYLRFRLK